MRQTRRRSLAMPQQTVVVMRAHKRREQAACLAAGKQWNDERLVFPTETDELRSALNVRRNFRSLLKEAGFETPKDWTPRELRTSFVSVLSDHGIPIEVISRLVGHNGSGTTERVYRKQLRPVIAEGAEAMDEIFGDDDDATEEISQAGD
ncbi:tyrosine-type recombinase/integrase [Streptomyces sp. NPDC048288]|uniref:tyrosine-type recombinase/integrase n=1 Tax=Streptomyces sp. NPDC048288 TaxID=3365529 RepID=UPI0037122829